mmetsp:Transcript_28122/g.74240  ORF Transcript_28122/g.74240 Transcript_28122/m.74240 type:complete len:321 (+) Transcript_28122:116-1078(+)|eukprot:CAMPEP_0113693768 /NCGR_PEP_ID=MMETSP0038_2-20120614/19868_1 /TAXON_ID=2898 /ORGANISM="Cryptomonas paramecium" /LENGTH=320 /DNA_ID=CAMNT_0000615917 /DNA_START=109 /DNA_END=1071 /DNA_ORIENTATION=+ /assembly_acc=CAM_ASM_000170
MNTFVRDGFGCASADSSIGRPIFPNAYPPHVTQDLHIANFTSCVDPSPFLHSSARNIPSNLVNLDFADQDNTLAKRQGRAILTDDQARIIFKYKPSPFAKDRGRAGALARAFGVSVKTIRDIWIGRTWYRATFDLDPGKQDEVPNRLHKKPGRPRGAKDSKPRTKKARLYSECGLESSGIDCALQGEEDSSGSSSSQDSDDGEQPGEPHHAPDRPGEPHRASDGPVPQHASGEPANANDVQLRSPVAEHHQLPESIPSCEPSKERLDEPESDTFTRWLTQPIGSSPIERDPFHDDWPFWSRLNMGLQRVEPDEPPQPSKI